MAIVTLTAAARGQLDDLGLAIHARVLRLLERLQNWPHVSGVRALSGRLAGQYRLRTGDYRVQFRVVRDVVIIEKIGHRDRFCED